MKFKNVHAEGRKYLSGKDLLPGQVVWFRSSGRHYDFKGVVENGEVIIMPTPETPKYLHGARFGLWPNHRYLIDKE